MAEVPVQQAGAASESEGFELLPRLRGEPIGGPPMARFFCNSASFLCEARFRDFS